MAKIKISMERGSIFRVILGVVATVAFSVSAINNQDDIYRHLLFIFIGLAGTSREYSLYLIKKQEKEMTTFKD